MNGQDSMCLLKLLSDLSKSNRLEISAIHFDHQWRFDSKINECKIYEILRYNQNLFLNLYFLSYIKQCCII